MMSESLFFVLLSMLQLERKCIKSMKMSNEIDVLVTGCVNGGSQLTSLQNRG